MTPDEMRSLAAGIWPPKATPDMPLPEALTLAELHDRLERAVVTLTRMVDSAAALHNMTEYARLDGKRDGVRLALSYLDEMTR